MLAKILALIVGTASAAAVGEAVRLLEAPDAGVAERLIVVDITSRHEPLREIDIPLRRDLIDGRRTVRNKLTLAVANDPSGGNSWTGKGKGRNRGPNAKQTRRYTLPAPRHGRRKS